MEYSLEKLIQLLGIRKATLAKHAQSADTIWVTHQNMLIKQMELLIDIRKLQIELEVYYNELDYLQKHREDSYCPACKYMYETPDGRALTEEEVDRGGGCTLHPGRENQGGVCGDFKECGFFRADDYDLLKYNQIKLLGEFIKKEKSQLSSKETELSELEKKIKKIFGI